jgi:hypothetical protein
MPGLVPGIHVFLCFNEDVDGRVKPGHDEADHPAGISAFTANKCTMALA